MSKAQLREVGSETMAANNALSEALNRWFSEHGPTAIFKNCANCEHCPPNKSPAFCAKFNAHPFVFRCLFISSRAGESNWKRKGGVDFSTPP